MTAATAAAWVYAVLLVVAGVAKMATPAATGAALQGARLPSDHRLVRLLGAGEIVLGAAVLVLGGSVPAALLALAYAAFAVFAWRQSRSGAGCGCFGETDAPATRLHVAINVAGAAVATVAALAPAAPLRAALPRDALGALLLLGCLALATVVLRLALTALPELAAAVASASPGDDA